MIDHVEAPEIYVYSPDRRECYGALRNVESFTEDVRFNTCSEVQLKVANKICDPLTGEWIENPVYKNLEKNNLLFLCDDNEYFSFPNRTIGGNSFYSIINKSNIPSDYGRGVDNGYVSMTYENDGSILSHFRVQPETDLMNISVAKGYNWWNLSYIGEFGYNRSPSAWASRFDQVACDNFIPIEIYDVISLRTKYYLNVSNENIRYAKYEIFFYKENDANTLLASMIITSSVNADNIPYANPVYRFSINSLKVTDFQYFYGEGTDEEHFANLKESFAKQGGYIRITAYDNYYKYPNKSTHVETNTSAYLTEKRKYSSYYLVDGNTKWIGWSFPYDGWIKIYSGKRFCSKIDNDITDGVHSVPLKWFVIVDTEEDYDGNMQYKTVTAYSYEYTISNRTISLSEDTLPFYIPPKILDIVNGDNWIIDKAKYLAASQAKNAKQYMTEGLLNKVLEILPDWEVGHISSALMTRYRKIDDIDNSNLYSFLMNDIEALYQCYFVFDCDNKTISAYTQEDIVENSNIVLNWQNALTSLQIKDQDKNFVTALRVHTADDTYGVGLVNPTGNSTIYNFNSILDKLDFIADTTNNDPLSRNKITENGVTRNRTLKEAVIALQNYIATPNITVNGVTVNSLSSFRNNAQKFVEANLNLIKAESAVQQCISDYNSVLNKIAVTAEYEEKSYFQEEQIPTLTRLDQLRTLTSNYHTVPFRAKMDGESKDDSGLYNELKDCVKKYHEAKDSYDSYLSNYNTYLNILKGVAKKTNLNYYNQVKLTQQYASDNTIILSLLTPAEILALQPFIREGDWTNDNSVFSEEYDAKDITSTLISVFDQAKSDMDTFLSKPSYDFESDVVNWTTIPEMQQNFKKLKVGKTLYINSVDDEYVIPMLLELHINYFDKDDFTMTFTTNYKRKVTELRFYDLYSEVSRISATDSTFTFNE